jgi:hypothetical protein
MTPCAECQFGRLYRDNDERRGAAAQCHLLKAAAPGSEADCISNLVGARVRAGVPAGVVALKESR